MDEAIIGQRYRRIQSPRDYVRVMSGSLAGSVSIKTGQGFAAMPGKSFAKEFEHAPKRERKG